MSLDLDGMRLAIGASGNDDGGDGSGHVSAHEWGGSGWVQLGGDIDGEAAGDGLGASVSLSPDGTRVAIGALHNDGDGVDLDRVRVCEWVESSWIQLGGDLEGVEEADGGSGYSVSLSGDGGRVAIGAPGGEGTGIDSGPVHVHELARALVFSVPALDFGSGWLGVSVSHSFSIRNNTAGPLRIVRATVTGTHLGDFTVGTFSDAIPASGARDIGVTMTATGLAGSREAVLEVEVEGFGVRTVVLFGSVITEPSPPPAPVLGVPVEGDLAFVLSWTVPTSDPDSMATDYQYSQDGGVTWASTGGILTTYTVAGLVEGVEYRFRVRGVNAVGLGLGSNEQIARIVPPINPPDGGVAGIVLSSTSGELELGARVYPIPARDWLHILVPGSQEVAVRIYRIDGRQTYAASSTSASGLHRLKVKSWLPGIYILDLITPGHRSLHRLRKL